MLGGFYKKDQYKLSAAKYSNNFVSAFRRRRFLNEIMEAKHETTSSSSDETRVEVNVVKSRINSEDKALKISSPKQENISIGNSKEKDNELDCAKAEMSEVKEENQRLKKMLDRIENDYTSLKMQFFDILQHEKSPSIISSPKNKPPTNEENSEEDNEPEISLCLGLKGLKKRKKEDNNTSSITKEDDDAKKSMSEGLSLGFEIKSRCSPTIDLSKEIRSEKSGETLDDDNGKDGTRETWSPSKALKTTKEYSEKEGDTSQPSSTKRARVSVRARCDTPTMNDGCQWRKYGQKIAKGNPCPRAYYRCTVAPACPVRKQVQRCSKDMSVLITTYEGTHNHPLPAAANSMASTTSAAASILLSGSSTSQSGLTSFAPTTMTSANLNGMNFTLYNNNPTSTNQFNLPISSSHNTPPTITLDLTSTPSTYFNRRYSSSSSNYTSRSLDFSSSESKTTFPIGSWTNNNNNYLNYGSLFPSNSKANIDSISFGKPNYEQMTRHHQYPISDSSTSSSQQFLTETLTKVLTSDPSFQSAVAAAISSMVGSSCTNNNSMVSSLNHANAEGSTHNMRWTDQVQGILDSSVSPTYLNKPTSSTSSSTQKIGNFMVLQQQPFSCSLTKTSSPPDPKN